MLGRRLLAGGMSPDPAKVRRRELRPESPAAEGALTPVPRCPLAPLPLEERQTPSPLSRFPGPGARGALFMARQFIYLMQGLTKAYTGGKKVLENIHLPFYPDAKIGVLGPNGSGKSTLLQDHGRPRQGLSPARPGSPRAPPSATWRRSRSSIRRSRTSFGQRHGAASRKKTAIVDRYNELMMNYSDETADEAAKLQDIIDSQNLWDLESQVEMAMDALRCPPSDAVGRQPLRRREAPRGALPGCCCDSPTCCCSTSRPTISTPRSISWLERHLRDYPGRGPDHHPRPLLPRQRHRLDPRARSRPRHPLRGQLLRLSGRRRPSASRRKVARTWPRVKALEREREWIAPVAAGPPDQVQGPHQAPMTSWSKAAQAQDGCQTAADRHPGRRAAGRRGHRGRGPSQRPMATAC